MTVQAGGWILKHRQADREGPGGHRALSRLPTKTSRPLLTVLTLKVMPTDKPDSDCSEGLGCVLRALPARSPAQEASCSVALRSHQAQDPKALEHRPRWRQ